MIKALIIVVFSIIIISISASIFLVRRQKKEKLKTKLSNNYLDYS